MICIQGKLPRDVNIAVSGGIDSVAVLDFLAHRHRVSILHYDHNEGNSEAAVHFCVELAVKYSCKLILEKNTEEKPKALSEENFWRNQRQAFFKSFNGEVVLCHHLDDNVETWIWSSLHGQGKIIPYRNDNIIRPFMLNKKEEFLNWIKRNELEYVEDESNKDLSKMRNYMRAELIEKCKGVNPGIDKTIRKKLIRQYEELYGR